jgi:immune inhibitor A
VESSEVPDNPTGVWVGDYTVQPEDGGLGVFAHEFGHDLGLPDLYDTSGNTGGAENSTAFWTLMSSGANIGDGGQGIGDAPTDLGVWELFQLGWLDAQGGKGPFYEVARAGQTSTHTLGTNVPATSAGAQALFTVLPEREVPLALGAPYAGSYQFWSTQGNLINTTMSHAAAPGPLTAQVSYDIETDWDYAFVEAQVDGAWRPVVTDLSDTSGDQSGNNGSQTGITGSSGGWKPLSATLPAGTTAVRFRYQTDEAVAEKGFRVDQVANNGTVIGTAENDAEGWTFDGFKRTTGSEVERFFNAYVAENRQYDGYDTSLRTAYNFGWPITLPNKVEHYPYQNGLLVSYWNEQYSDNNVGDHPGGGLILPVDAHPALPHWSDGTLMRPRAASYDSTFGLERTEPITLHTQVVGRNGKPVDLTGSIASQPAVPTFDDTLTWWLASDQHVKKGVHPGRYQPGWYSVNPPRTGTTITVQSTSGSSMSVKVAPK